MTTTTTNKKTHKETNQAIEKILQDRDNWDSNGKELFQTILEGVLIEVEEDIAKENKKNSVDDIVLDSETNAEINKLLSEDDTWDSQDEEITDTNNTNSYY
jgi:hypothetical protein